MPLDPTDSVSGRGPEEDVERKKRDSISRRVEERLEHLGTNARAVSKACGFGNTYVHEVISGKIKNPPRDKLERIASELQCSLEYLEGAIVSPYAEDRPIRPEGRPIPVSGYVEPGAFRKMTYQETHTVNYSLHQQYPQAKHFIFEVRGDDMDAATYRGRRAPIYEGMAVACVDIASAGVPVQNGEIYVIEHSTDGGKTAERLLRRALVFIDHIELVAESTMPERPTFVLHGNGSRPNGVKVIGLVYGMLFDRQR